MSEATLAAGSERTGWFDRATSLLFHVGRGVFSLAIVALGVETLVCARYVTAGLGPQYKVIPVLPWLPRFLGLAYLFGAILVACGAGLLSQRTARMAATTLGVCCFCARSFSKCRKTQRILAAYRCARRCLSLSRSQVSLGSFLGVSQCRISSRAQAATCAL